VNPRGRPTDATRQRVSAVLLFGLIAIGGCVSVRTTGAASIQDMQAEDAYKAVYAEQMTRVRTDNVAFQPTSSSPGVCNKGGSQQGCFDADAVMIQDFKATQNALAATAVPPRYVEADGLLREAIAEDIRGLELRNKAIAEHDDAAWTEHKVVLDKAIAGFQEAYLAFPADNRPQPSP
jgi:hypothetical protein